MVGVEGQSLSVQEMEWWAHPSIGGVILFSRNYVDPAQLTDLVASIKAIKSPELLVAVDQEGGRVQRFVAGLLHCRRNIKLECFLKMILTALRNSLGF